MEGDKSVVGVFILIFHIKKKLQVFPCDILFQALLNEYVWDNSVITIPPLFPFLPPLPSEGSGEAPYISGKLIPFIF